MRQNMRRIIECMDVRQHVVEAVDGSVVVELDGSVSSACSLWQMVLAMAMKDRAWCIQYDVHHPLRLLYVTSCSVYGLVPPPDEMAQAMVRAIDRITMPTSAVGQ